MEELILYSLYSTYRKLLCIPLHRIKDSLKNKNKPKPKQINKKNFHTYSLPFATVLTLHVDHMRVCFSSVVSCCLSSYIARSLLKYALNIENYKVTMFYIFLICNFFLFFVIEKYIGEGRNHLFFFSNKQPVSCVDLGRVCGFLCGPNTLHLHFFSGFSHCQLCPLSSENLWSKGVFLFVPHIFFLSLVWSWNIFAEVKD